jgi:hypothetical protein
MKRFFGVKRNCKGIITGKVQITVFKIILNRALTVFCGFSILI